MNRSFPSIFPFAIAIVGMIFVAGPTPAAHGGIVVQPMSVFAVSSEVSNRDAIETVNGSGLSDATLVETGDPVPSPYPTHSVEQPGRVVVRCE